MVFQKQYLHIKLLVSYEGAKFVNIVELRPGDVCGQYYRLHNSLITNIKAGDLLTIVLRVIVENKIICDSKVKYVYKEVGNMLVLKDRLYSRITKYETNVPAFSKTIKGYGRELEKQLIQQYLEQQLVVIYGPSRVGKSSLVNYISNEYIEEYSRNENKGIVAISIAVQRLTVATVHPFHGRDSLWNDRTLAVFRLLITDQGGFHHDTRHKNRH